MSKGILTEYTSICAFCGKPVEAEHHLIFGTAGRELAEEDGLKLPACNNCHNMGRIQSRIHDNPMAEKLSKMLGQMAWEKQRIQQKAGKNPEEQKKENSQIRKEFIKRYGKSYL